MEALKPCLEPIQNPQSKTCTEQSRSIQNQSIWLPLDEIQRDGGTQPRVKMDLAHIKRLEEQIEEGHSLEPVVVFYDGESYWLADGFHRWQANSNQEQEAIACIIHQGSRRDAILYSVGANADHKPALPRSREDKRRAVMTLLRDPEWKDWSNYKIAEVCRVNEKTVRNIRKTLTTDFRSEGENVTTDLTPNFRNDDSTRTYTTKHGTVATMKTANIGRQKGSSSSDAKGDNVEAVGESTSTKQSGFPEMTQSNPVPPRKVEVSTDDILIAFISNLDCMSTGQIEAVGKELAGKHQQKAEAMVKAIAALNPNLIRQVMASELKSEVSLLNHEQR